MDLSTYTTYKSEIERYIHVHLLINNDHHIIEINNVMAMIKNYYLPRKYIENVIYEQDNLDTFIFQADNMGFNDDMMTEDEKMKATVEGNVTDCEYDESRLMIKIEPKDDIKTLIITSNFNNKQVESIIPIKTNTDKGELVDSLFRIMKTLRKASLEFFDICMLTSYPDEAW